MRSPDLDKESFEGIWREYPMNRIWRTEVGRYEGFEKEGEEQRNVG
jgi:hypothetical protein